MSYHITPDEFDQLLADVKGMQDRGEIPSTLTREQRISWAYGQTKIGNDKITREDAELAVDAANLKRLFEQLKIAPDQPLVEGVGAAQAAYKLRKLQKELAALTVAWGLEGQQVVNRFTSWVDQRLEDLKAETIAYNEQVTASLRARTPEEKATDKELSDTWSTCDADGLEDL